MRHLRLFATPPAQDDIDEQALYIAGENLDAGLRLLDAIDHARVIFVTNFSSASEWLAITRHPDASTPHRQGEEESIPSLTKQGSDAVTLQAL